MRISVERGADRRPARGRRAGAFLLAGILAAACAAPAPKAEDAGKGSGAGSPARDARRAEVRFPDGRTFEAEIADTPARWEQGYMFRREVGDRDAMIFIFPEPELHSFWMKNTLVPLDMIWLDDEVTVIHIQPKARPCKSDPCPGYGPPRKSRYVLEVKSGVAAQEGLKIGDRLQISFPQAG